MTLVGDIPPPGRWCHVCEVGTSAPTCWLCGRETVYSHPGTTSATPPVKREGNQ